MWVLAHILHWVTGKARYFPDFEWSDTLWTHNVFRFLGTIFGERYGIRPSIASWQYEGTTYQCAYSLEGQVALFETYIRSLSKKFSFKVITLPQLQLAGISSGGIIPYRFAIAFDAAAGTGANNTPLTQVCTGTNLLLYVFDIGDDTGDDLTGITYNSVSMTFAGKVQTPTDRWTYGYVLVNPSTGSHTVNPSGNTFNECGAMSYTGCKQSAQPDSVGTNSTASSGTTFSVATTVVAANCWLSNGINGGIWVSDLSSVGRSISGHRLRDSNGTVSTGSQSVGMTVNTTGYIMGGVTISIAPFISAAVSIPFRTLLGVGI